jgi:outer membrane lipopolysaccharide assembly protein LptE/RlpB
MMVSNANTAKIQIIKSQTHYIPAWHDQSQKIAEYKTTYRVTASSLKSNNQHAVHYAKTIKISQNYVVPNQNKMLVVVKYFGIPEETGYDIEDPVLLLPAK